MGKPESPDIYRSPNLPQYEDAALSGVMNRLGANGPVSGGGSYTYGGRPTSSAKSTNGWSGGTAPGTFPLQGGAYRMPATGGGGWANTFANSGAAKGDFGNLHNYEGQTRKQQSPYNTSQIGSPLGGAAGLRVATDGYDFSPTDDAISGFRKGYASNNPYQFNFGQLPDEYTNLAYQSGASDINRAGRDQLTQLREAAGTRRPGALLRAGEAVSRDTNRNLADLNTKLRLNQINQNLQLGRDQQVAQAGENRAAQQMAMSYLSALMGAGQNKIGTQSGLLQNERAYQDKALDYLMNIYNNATGQANQAAALQASQQGSAMNSLLGLGGLGVGIASLIPGVGAAAIPAAAAGGGFNLGNFGSLLSI